MVLEQAMLDGLPRTKTDFSVCAYLRRPGNKGILLGRVPFSFSCVSFFYGVVSDGLLQSPERIWTFESTTDHNQILTVSIAISEISGWNEILLLSRSSVVRQISKTKHHWTMFEINSSPNFIGERKLVFNFLTVKCLAICQIHYVRYSSKKYTECDVVRLSCGRLVFVFSPCKEW